MSMMPVPSTSHAATPSDPTKIRRVEMILRQIDSLPTLPAVATRLLALTTNDQTETKQVVELIASDPALTSKILSICRRADMGIRGEANTIDKAVVLLGFTAVRNAVLSIKVYEMISHNPRTSEGQAAALDSHVAGSDNTTGRGTVMELDRAGFSRHCLAVAVIAEQLATLLHDPQVDPHEAFVGGLLHDVGKLALDYVLPRSFGRVVELAELNQGNIAEYERRIIGIDHHTAGKRLAEQWSLSHRLQDCIWLHGSPYDMLPRLDHKKLVGLVGLADLLARKCHLGYSGNFNLTVDEYDFARRLGLEQRAVQTVIHDAHQELDRRCRTLGLDELPSQDLFIKSLQQANQMLGSLNAAMDRRGRQAVRQAQMLDAISAFHAAAVPGRTVEDVMSAVVTNAISVLGSGFYAMVYQGRADDSWLVCRFDSEGHIVGSQMIEPPSSCPNIVTLDANQPAAINPMGIMPWLTDCLADANDLRQIRVLPLGCGWGTSALLLHDQASLPPWQQMVALSSTWGAAIAAAGQHDGARRLGEELAQANTALAEAQDRLLQTESMARVGEMAAGAAHEMNNPLTIISGRSQLLAQTLADKSKEQQAAALIVEQSHRLSDLISMLRFYADPPKAERKMVNLQPLLEQAISAAKTKLNPNETFPAVKITILPEPVDVNVDRQQISNALAELLLNAQQAGPKTEIQLQARLDSSRRWLMIEVTDDGGGMDAHTLAHAMDPFFSSKSAGRRIGMGLPRAQIYAQSHGGRIELRSINGKGSVVTIVLPLDSQS